MRDPSADLASSVIMMVDDESTTLDVMEMFLREQGYAGFVKTTEARQVVELVRAERPDVVLLNLVMPGLGGFELLDRLRADPELADVPVVLVTSSTDAETKRRAVAHGATDFLSKPVDRSELALRVRNTLAAHAWREGRQETGQGTERAAANGPPIVSRLDGGDARCVTIVERFVERLEEKLGAMEELALAGDLEALANLAHWLKGAAGTVGFDAFTQPAERLRAAAREGKHAEVGAALEAIRNMAERIVVPDAGRNAEVREG